MKNSVSSGMLSESVTVRNVRNQTVIKSRPQVRLGLEGIDRSKQEAVRTKFKAASMYAKAQIGSPESKALYLTGVNSQKRNAFVVAMTDFLNAPISAIENVRNYGGKISDPITVNAMDDFAVTRVEVEITDASGAIIELGDAVVNPIKPTEWVYATTVANPNLSGTKIRAVAYDRPGNSGVSEVIL